MKASKHFRFLFGVGIAILSPLFLTTCGSVKPTETDDSKLKVKVSNAGTQNITGGVIAWAEVYLTSGGFDEDYVTITTPPTATNVRYRVSPAPYWYNSPCDPLAGQSIAYVIVDNQTPGHVFETNWINLPNGSHTFYVYASATRSSDPTACSECEAPPGECVAEARAQVTVLWQ